MELHYRAISPSRRSGFGSEFSYLQALMEKIPIAGIKIDSKVNELEYF